MWSIFKQYIIYTVIAVFQLYDNVIAQFYNYFGSKKIIYYIHNNCKKNITLNYYFNIGLYKYITGQYYCKIYNTNSVNSFVFVGALNAIDGICLGNIDLKLKRKNIVLLKNENISTVDLNILDDYVYNMKCLQQNNPNIYNEKCMNLMYIFKCLNIDCTHVQYTTLKPFKQVTCDINKCCVDDLYR